jgi:hypothetical protein
VNGYTLYNTSKHQLPPRVFGSNDITEILVGITTNYLDTILQRKHYGISESAADRHEGRNFRLFGEADVFGIALVWMLFESGLRAPAIRDVLNKVARTKKADAKASAEVLIRSKAEYLVVVREPRKPKNRLDPEGRIIQAKEEDLAGIIDDNPTANILMVPVGTKFNDIRKRIEIVYAK